MLEVSSENLERMKKEGITQEDLKQIETFTEYQKICEILKIKADFESFAYSKYGFLI